MTTSGRDRWHEDNPEGDLPGTGAREDEANIDGRAFDPAGRPEPYVDGPTGPAPLASELRGDPGEDGDRQGEGGAMGGALAGTAVAGPLGGLIGGVVGATIGTAAEGTSDEHLPDDERDADMPSDTSVSNVDR